MRHIKTTDDDGRESILTIFDDRGEKDNHIDQLIRLSDVYRIAMCSGPLIDADLFRQFIELNYIIEKLCRIEILQWDFPEWMELCRGTGRYQNQTPGIIFFSAWFMRRVYTRLLADVVDGGAA